MSAPNSGLPDLTIWDSIRDCATASLRNLTATIEVEISRDQTLAELARTGSAQIALEHRVLGWMGRAFACCLNCWEIGQGKEETAEFRTAVCIYGLSPFYSQHILRLLRLGAGVSRETVDLLEKRSVSYSPQEEQSALRNASTVYSKVMTSWFAVLPPIKKRVAPPPVRAQIVSRAPEPPHQLSGTGGWALPKPKAIMLPTDLPPGFPSALALRARIILADVVKEFSDCSKLEQFCKELVTRFTDLLCIGVRSGILKPYAALDELDEILNSILVTNCNRDTDRSAMEQQVMNSEAWHSMLSALSEFESNPEPEKLDNSSTETSLVRQRIDRFIETVTEHGRSITRRDIW
jgi:hypothetical protein